MKTKKSKASAVLFVIAALFLIYGIYAVINAVTYVNTYTTASTITTMGSIHYIVTSSMAYFGFASVLVAAALILKNQANISVLSQDSSEGKNTADPLEVNGTADDSDVKSTADAPDELIDKPDARNSSIDEPSEDEPSKKIENCSSSAIDVQEIIKSFKYPDTVPLPDNLTEEINRDFDRASALL